MAMSSERNERNAIGYHRVIRGINNFEHVMASDWDQLDDGCKDAMRDFAQRVDSVAKSGDFPPDPPPPPPEPPIEGEPAKAMG